MRATNRHIWLPRHELHLMLQKPSQQPNPKRSPPSPKQSGPNCENLLQRHRCLHRTSGPTKRPPTHPPPSPRDVAWTNHPQAMDEFSSCPYGMTGADVVITPNLPLPPPTSENDFDNQTTHVVRHHQQAERGKYKNRTRYEKSKDADGKTLTTTTIPGHQIIQELNDSNILLCAFTVDPLGQTGPI
eukprot:scaffold27391_cov67-Attheya_sp.AAC.5